MPMRLLQFSPEESIKIVSDAARKLKCTETHLFVKAAAYAGYVAYKRQAAIWLSHYVERRVPDEVIDFCLSVMTGRAHEPGSLK